MLDNLIETFGEPALLLTLGLLVGGLFGAGAQHSRFCMRASAVEVASLRFGPRMMIWIICFAAAVSGTQTAIAAGWIDVSNARQLAATGSLSGAIIGGVLFGAGMVLARGCASRLLVLSATGNLRAIITGLVLTLVAQASLRGVLSPARETLSQLWLVDGGSARNILTQLNISNTSAGAVTLVVLSGAIIMARGSGQPVSRIVAALAVGLAVALGWVGTGVIAQHSFDIVPISSVTFTGPSTDTLMGLVSDTSLPMTFAVGLVPGVFLGSALMAISTREFGVERFGPDTPMERYLVGAILMGFGSMLAGGCAVGATVSGGAVMAVTAWVAGLSMWSGAIVTNWLMAAGSGLSKRAA